MKTVSVLCCLSLSVTLARAANILIVLPFPWYSHTQPFIPVFRELAHRGHNVTMVSPYPQKEPLPNWTDITVDSSVFTSVMETSLKELFFLSPLLFYYHFWKLCHNNMAAAFEEQAMQKLIKAEDLNFDLLIIESIFAQEPLVALGHKLKVPVVAIHPLSLTPWQSFLTGNEFSFSLKVNYRTKFTEKMSFFQSLYNSLINMIEFASAYFYYIPKQEKLMEKYMVYPGCEDRPSLLTMLRNVSLFLIDYHYSVGYLDSFHPNTIPVGGLSVNKNVSLPKDLQELMDKSTNGVILLSFGSFVNWDKLPKGIMEYFMEAFGKLEQTVLVKSDLEIINKPKNVVIRKWLPQNGILGHPNTRLFVTHAGIHSITEAVYFGVPVLCVPLFTDQEYNSRFSEMTGFGLTLLIQDITPDSIYNSISTILKNPRFKEAVLQRSEILKDRPQPALETAVYWIEYVIRHRGARHLRPARQDLHLYQYYIDATFYLLLSICLLSWLLFKAVRIAFRAFLKKSIKKKRD